MAGAASGGHLDIIEAFIGTLGVDVDAIDHYGETALMRAAGNGRTDTVNALAGTHNANVDAVDEDGKTALMIAAKYGHTDIVNALRRLRVAKIKDAVTCQSSPIPHGVEPKCDVM